MNEKAIDRTLAALDKAVNVLPYVSSLDTVGESEHSLLNVLSKELADARSVLYEAYKMTDSQDAAANIPAVPDVSSILMSFCRELLERLYGKDNPSVERCLSDLNNLIKEKYHGNNP